jgi:PKD repeat protein
MRRTRPIVSALAVSFLASTGLAAGGLSLAAPAAADTAPAAPLPRTVAADALPTAQINGVVWDQQIVGGTVYVGGSFTSARPAGTPAGTSEQARSNLMAFDLATGALLPFAPRANGQVNDLALSPDGRTLYVAGSFTSIDGQSRLRVAAFDTATGALTAFRPSVNATVNAIGATATSVAIGGIFGSVGGQPRARVAVLSAATGAPTAFAAAVDNNSVQALVMSPDGASVVIGGNFTTVAGSGSPGYGLARLSLATGASLPLPVNAEVRNAGTNSAILSLETDGTSFYGSGYHFSRTGNVEGVFAADWATGSTRWVEDCHGDTYGVFPVGDVVYAASHKHFCGNSGGFPQTEPWSYHRATAMSRTAQGRNTADYYGYPDHRGVPSPALLTWFPDIDAGTYTGKSQGPWTVTGNADYVVYGGEFLNVNGRPQQGLVRFARPELAPNAVGPRLTSASFSLRADSPAAGTVALSWTGNWDRDNRTLTYRLYRQSTAAAPIVQREASADFWALPVLGHLDTGQPPGSTQRYRVSATDPAGNVAWSDWASVTVAASGALGAYQQQVRADEPVSLWRLGEPSGTGVGDAVGWDPMTAGTGVTRGAGAIAGDPNGSATFGGSSTGGAVAVDPSNGDTVFSVEAWIRTTTTRGGKVIGFGNRQTGTSTIGDRHLYLDDSGRVVLGVQSSGLDTVRSAAAVNDGRWHHLVGTYATGRLTLYVDGQVAAQRADITHVRQYWGWWRLGGDRLQGWPNRPSSDWFAGSIDEAAVYRTELTAGQVATHYARGTGTAPADQPPVAAFTAAATGLTVAVDGSASSDVEGPVAAWAWDFGDGGTSSGVRASHAYAAAGTYAVRLTVTDGSGRTGSATRQVAVQPPANQPPVAAFTSAADGLTAAFDASGSTDPDGTVTAWRWSFGDGATATGVTASHAFAAAGTYQVTLEVSDDRGATGALTRPVVVATRPPDAPGVLDAFGRTATGGWGAADRGGDWQVAGAAGRYSVDGGGGVHLVAAGGTTTSALPTPLGTTVDARVGVTPAQVPGGGGAFVHVQARRVSDILWLGARLRLQADGSVQLHVTRNGTPLAGGVVAGLTYHAGDRLEVRVQVVGTAPATLQSKAWLAGTPEPAGWRAVTTDQTPELQAPGGFGLQTYLFGTATNGPLRIAYDDLSVTTTV